MAQSRTRRSSRLSSDELSGYPEILAEIGPETEQATTALKGVIDNSPLLSSKWKTDIFPRLVEALKSWKDSEAAAIVNAVHNRLSSNLNFDLAALSGWIEAHRQDEDAQAVIDCLTVDPPEETKIIRLLSRAGSQKLVFLANWRIAQKEVVLKRFIGAESVEHLISRELRVHPLSMVHPNIIETHKIINSKGDKFLVERYLPKVLDDSWLSHGVHEAANLLYDIAKALTFLQEEELVHGDIKPDNIGYEDGNYILLDFGICRSLGAFAKNTTATGSLRTRAPELLIATSTHSYASDIWALGATVYNAIVARFPLFDTGESPPRVSRPEERSKYEQELARRVREQWDSRVDVSVVPEPLRILLAETLSRDEDKRPKASDLVKQCEEELAAFLRRTEGPDPFSPSEELAQLKAHLPDKQVLELMPHSEKYQLRALLKNLKSAKGLTEEQNEDISALCARLA